MIKTPMTIELDSYDKIREKYSNAVDWMSDIGVKIGPNRLSNYSRLIENKTYIESKGKDVFPDYVSSMFEIYHFLEVYSAFKDTPKEQLNSIVSKLDKSVNGPKNTSEETSKTTEARNYLFEAVTAARLHRPSSDLEAILKTDSDTGVQIGNNKIWIECKRITTPNKIYDNVRKATTQLETVLKRKVGSGHRGLVALDISKILNEGDKIFVKETELEFFASVDSIMDKFIAQYSHQWEKVYARRNKKIIGIVIRFAFMSCVEDKNTLVYTSQWAVNPRAGVDHADLQLQKLLTKSLNM